jgi:hypothetical protein
VDPLPFVPPTVKTGQVWGSCRASRTARTRSKPELDGLTVARLQQAVQPSIKSSGNCISGRGGDGGLASQQGEELGQAVTQLARSMIMSSAPFSSRNSERWKAGRKGLPDGLFDHPRPGKADQGTGLTNHQIPHEGETGRNATHGRIGQQV